MSIIDDAVAQIRSLVGDWIEDVPVFGDYGELMEALQEAEIMAAEVYQALSILYQNNATSRLDLLNYDNMRDTLYQAQRKMYAETIGKVRQYSPALGIVGSEILDSLPEPQRLPSINSRAVLSGRGLGAAPAAVPAAVVASPVFWAAAVIVILAAIGMWILITAAVASSVLAISLVGIAHSYAKAMQATVEGRVSIFQSCLAEGNPSLECSQLAVATVPTPAQALPELPNLVGDFASIFKWVGITVIASSIGLLGYFVLRNKKS